MDPAEQAILIVDDSATMRAVVRTALEGMGLPPAGILEAEDGAQALKLLEERPDGVRLVLSDWLMPVVDGLELLRRMKRSDSLRSIPVIMLTCQGQPDNIVQAMQEGARDYLVKPFKTEALARKITEATGAELHLPEPARRKLGILLVDDSASMRKFLRAAVDTVPALAPEYLEAGDGVEAMAQLARHPNAVDLILADFEMPNMDGLELLRQLKRSKDLARIPFVMVTSVSRQDKMLEVTRAGALGYIVKPFQAATVRDKILEILVGRNADVAPTDVTVMRRALAQAAKTERAALPFLAQLPESLRLVIDSRAARRRHPAGAELVKPNEVVPAFQILESGEVEVLAPGQERVIDVRKAGDCFGYTSFLSGEPAVRRARARTEVVALALEKDAFESILREHPYFGVYLSRLLASRLERNAGTLSGKAAIGLSGQIGMMSMVDVVQTLHTSLKTGLLRVTRNAESGEIYLVEGEVQHAAAEGQIGEAAFYALVRWDTGSFSFQPGPRDYKPEGMPGTMQLLMEGVRLLDEAGRGGPPA